MQVHSAARPICLLMMDAHDMPGDLTNPTRLVRGVGRRRGRSLFTIAAAAGLLCAALGVSGCRQPSPAGRPFVLSDEGTPEASWPFWARAMRIHPLSRITDDPQNPQQILVETRIEFTDSWNDPCKAVGLLTLDLLDVDDPGRFDPARDRYEVDLRDLAVNVERWDPVTRTYVLKLEVSRLRVPVAPRLSVTFESVDGGEVADQASIRPYANP